MDLMRQLDFEYKVYWDKKSQLSPNMITEKDCDPTLLSGWTDHDISLWDVSAKDGKPGLIEILFALCRNKKDWKKISYLQFTKEAVDNTGLTLSPTPGKTTDCRINQSNTHFEIKDITGKELCTLLFNVYNGNFVTGIFTKAQYDKILYDLYDNTEIRQIIYSSTAQSTNFVNPPVDSTKEKTSAENPPSQKTVDSTSISKIPKPISSTKNE